jgi:hypothetical protein
LLCYCATSVVEGNVELYSLTSAQKWLAFDKVLWHRQKIIAMHKKVTIKGGRVEETPPVGTTTDVSPVPLAEALLRLSTKNGFECDGMWATVVISLYIKLNRFAFVVRVILKLRHDSVGLEKNITLEHVAPYAAASIRSDKAGDVFL